MSNSFDECSLALNTFMDHAHSFCAEFADDRQRYNIAKVMCDLLLKGHWLPADHISCPMVRFADPISNKLTYRKFCNEVIAHFQEQDAPSSTRSIILSFFHTGGAYRGDFDDLWDDFLDFMDDIYDYDPYASETGASTEAPIVIDE